MQKSILITGSTDGIGLAAAKQLLGQGHHVLLHGRNLVKLKKVEQLLAGIPGGGQISSYQADLSDLKQVEAMAKAVADQEESLDVLINNAGVFKAKDQITQDGLDVRFVVNTIAPYLLTKALLPLMGNTGRVINLSSAAQAPVDLDALNGQIRLGDDFQAYAQSKLAITAWSRHMGLSLKNGPVIISVNPGSYLGTKMVKDAFGMEGRSIGIGADILVRAALSSEFETASGMYFDNDAGKFAAPHPDAQHPKKAQAIVEALERMLSV